MDMSRYVLGLTGQSGSGKTTVSRLFLKHGFNVINADELAHNIMNASDSCLQKIVLHFGEDILNSDNHLNRRKLASIVFNSKEQLQILNNITNPYILKAIKNEIENSENRNIILDAPTLFESGADKFCDETASVIADRAIRVKRITERDCISEDEAVSRINSQNDDDFYIKRSDYIIDNSFSLDELKKKTEFLIFKIKSKLGE